MAANVFELPHHVGARSFLPREVDIGSGLIIDDRARRG
jgi:hypothetical protein